MDEGWGSVGTLGTRASIKQAKTASNEGFILTESSPALGEGD